MTYSPLSVVVAIGGLLATSATVPAALVARYDFTDGDLLDDDKEEAGPSYTLSLTTGGPNTITITPHGAASFPGEDVAGNQDFLDVTGPGGTPSFTVSFWFRTGAVNQGNYQGLFSNNTSNTSGNFSWQVDISGGVLRLVSATSGFGSLTNEDPGEPPVLANTWHHVVARKTGGGGQLWFGTEGDLQLVGSNSVNPGGLQMFRLGVNRNSDSLYTMEMANVRIYNDDGISLDFLNGEGPRLVPEGGQTLPLLCIALGGIFLRLRRP